MLTGINEMVPTTSVGVVDDDENPCRSTARLLRASGIQVGHYLSAQEFLDSASRLHFDCLLLDIQLEGMSGIELSERLAAPRWGRSGCDLHAVHSLIGA
jgi:FixJ family two-component response regulator